MDRPEKFRQLINSSDTLSVKRIDKSDLSDSSLPETVANSENQKRQDILDSRARTVFLCSVCDYCTFKEENIKWHTKEHRKQVCASYESCIVISRDENGSENESSCSSLPETVLNVDINTKTEKLPSIARVVFRCFVCEYCSFNEENIKRHINEHKNSSLNSLESSSNSSVICIRPQSTDELATEKVNVDYLFTCDGCPYETHEVKEFSSHLNVHSWLNKNKVKNDPVPESKSTRYFLRYRPPKVKKYGNPLTEQSTRTKFFCEHCQFSCDESCTLFRHQAVHAAKSQPHRKTTKTSPEIFYCLYNYCSFFCGNLDLLKRHQEFHEEKLQTLLDQNKKKPKFICHKCGFSCAEQEQIVLHDSVHSESSQNLKSSVQMIASRKRKKSVVEQFSTCSLSKDFEVNDEIKQNGFLCSICSTIFQTEKQLQSHEMSHDSFSEKYEEMLDDPQIFKCTKCSNSYSLKLYLDLHQHLHDVKFKCLYCGKEYKRQPAFKKHMRICKHKA